MKELEGLNINILCPLFHSLSNSGVLPHTYLLSWIVVTAHYPWDTQHWAGYLVLVRPVVKYQAPILGCTLLPRSLECIMKSVRNEKL